MSALAFSYLLPGFSPKKIKLVFDDTDDENVAPSFEAFSSSSCLEYELKEPVMTITYPSNIPWASSTFDTSTPSSNNSLIVEILAWSEKYFS